MRPRSACATLLCLALGVAGSGRVLAKPTGKAAPSASASTSASATPPPAPLTADEADARRHFEIGLKLYAEKAYEAALTEFEASYKLNPRPSALRNVAQSHRDLKHFAQAHDTYARLVDKHLGQLSPTEKSAVLKAMRDLEIVTGSIELTLAEPGAAVQIDGRAIGTTPLEKPLRVDPGTHALKIFKSGFEPVEREVTLVAQQAEKLTITLVKENKTGHVTIREEGGNDVHVFLDDVDVGPAPWSGDVAPGPHTVELKGETVAAAKRPFEIASKASLDVAMVATPLLGHLHVLTLGKVGALFVDGKKVGDGEWEADLPPGSYEVSVVADGYLPYKHLVSVTKGQALEEAVTLVAKPPPAPPPAAPPKPPVDPFLGLFARFNPIVLFAAAGGPELASTCSASGVATCSNSGSDLAVGVKLDVGYQWDALGLAVVGAFAFDTPHEIDRSYPGRGPIAAGTTINDSSPRSEVHKLGGLRAFLGVGPRVTSMDDAVRFTLGAAFGGVYRSLSYKRETLGDTFSSTAGGFTPALAVDAGLLLGGTPGTKFTIGVLAWMELGGTLQTDDGGLRTGTVTGGTVKIPTPPQTLASGVQLFVGPTLGLQFGR